MDTELMEKEYNRLEGKRENIVLTTQKTDDENLKNTYFIDLNNIARRYAEIIEQALRKFKNQEPEVIKCLFPECKKFSFSYETRDKHLTEHIEAQLK